MDVTPPPYYALLADIHGNLAALLAVAADARALAKQDGAPLRFLCLGDVVDYGPQPVECIAWVARHATAVLGNHDRAALGAGPPLGIDGEHWPILIWTRHALDEQARARIAAWPETLTLGPLALFHSSLAERDVYITGTGPATACLLRLPAGAPIGLFGHTHMASLFLQQGVDVTLGLPCPPGVHLRAPGAQALAYDSWLDLPAGDGRALLNPGSVGQPRSHPLLAGAGVSLGGSACYALLREAEGRWQVSFRAVPYDAERTARLLEGLAWRGAPAPELGAGHPGARRLREVYAAMDTLLPAAAARLAARLRAGRP